VALNWLLYVALNWFLHTAFNATLKIHEENSNYYGKKEKIIFKKG